MSRQLLSVSVFRDLPGNPGRAQGEAGAFEFAVQRAEVYAAGQIGVRAEWRDDMAEISAIDTGVGITSDDQEKVFEEFRQVGTEAKKVEGTGLGLAISRKFIRLHGGRIWVKSQVGAGSTFAFTLPCSEFTSSAVPRIGWCERLNSTGSNGSGAEIRSCRSTTGHFRSDGLTRPVCR
jgi:signal transduction histidine kinase